MPRDIRSYFHSAKTNSSIAPAKSTKRRIISSDEDDEKIPSPVKRSKKRKTLGSNVISNDSQSDEEAKQKKIVSPRDIFSKKPINRQEAPKILKKLQKKEAASHNDEDFEATLSQLDTSDIEQKYLEETKPSKDAVLQNSPKSSFENDDGKTTPVKNKSEVKKDIELNKKKHEGKTKKHSNNSTSDDTEQKDSKLNGKSKHAKNTSKAKSSTYKLEIEQPKKKSPKKVEVSDEYEKRADKRKQGSAMYQKYLQRGGARNPGSKEIPEGAEYCLAGLSFLITGVLESLEREEAEELIKKYGGRLLQQVSSKTDYVIVGDEPGPAKISKANSLNIKQISEDDLLDMIRTRKSGQVKDVKESRTKSKDRMKQKSIESDDTPPAPSKRAKITSHQETEKLQSPHKKEDRGEVTEKIHDDKDATKKAIIKSPVKDDKKDAKSIENLQTKPDSLQDINRSEPVQALVEKYRPKAMKQILGQQGDKSNAKKLHTWLKSWHKNRSSQVKLVKPSPWAKNDDGAFFKAALLSGPPGIGKTTTVQVVCDELGFDLIEFNASDTRSKKLLQESVSELLSNTTLKDYFIDTKNKPTSKHVLLMDEVDGMAGNEDRGGLQELISLIKSTDVPIVCICNDRNNTKMRTLANYIFDLRFPKPRLEQIRGAMKSICFKENINISTEDLDRLIESTNQDIRQIINHLALFVGNTGTQEKSQKKHINKDLKLGPWDVVKQVFSAEDHKTMSIHDKSDLFFHDYNIAPLFVQENYLAVAPAGPKDKLLEKVAKTSESLAMGDIVEKSIRSNGSWSLLPMQACYSSVIPGTVMSGHVAGQINFPAWLGRNSKSGKFDRLMQEITVHTRLTTGASKEAIILDYIRPIRDAIVRPLAVDGSEGVNAAVDVMSHYHLLREDLDSLIETSLWPGDRDPMQVIDSKVKAAFTRSYNKSSAAVPYAVSGVSKKKTTQSKEGNDYLEDGDSGEENSDDDNVETDKMIKAKKATSNKKTESKGKSTEKTVTKGKSSDKPSTSKRGRGRGKAK
ncbi:germ line transcription factor 1 isoform X2 [Lasioglossum baleicum]|uniref:germ line transcription factor 1 isoform X2 n=1 Tax=Lasioglossum baleicum TaxID=434251 RepID=UPI003FCE35DB